MGCWRLRLAAKCQLMWKAAIYSGISICHICIWIHFICIIFPFDMNFRQFFAFSHRWFSFCLFHDALHFLETFCLQLSDLICRIDSELHWHELISDYHSNNISRQICLSELLAPTGALVVMMVYHISKATFSDFHSVSSLNVPMFQCSNVPKEK